MSGVNSFLYSYLVDGIPRGSTLSVLLGTEGAILLAGDPPTPSSVSLSSVVPPDASPATLDLNDEGYITELGYNDSVFTYAGLITTAGVTGVLVQVGTDYFIYTESQLSYTPGDSSLSLSYNTDPYNLCFLRGTRILTSEGERPIEDLVAGDLVVTADGGPVPVRWIGRQSHHVAFAPEARPITIAAGAIGEGIPRRDLHVSPDHALLVEGYLVNARALVNGMSIRPMQDAQGIVEYFHIELAGHHLVLAEGAPAESFVDDVTRANFDNYQEWLDAGLEPIPGEALGFLKVKSARQLPRAVRERLLRRARDLGYLAETQTG